MTTLVKMFNYLLLPFAELAGKIAAAADTEA